jgi:hypothetical protein
MLGGALFPRSRFPFPAFPFPVSRFPFPAFRIPDRFPCRLTIFSVTLRRRRSSRNDAPDDAEDAKDQ